MQAALSSLFIVWRESIEALLVIGILYAWLKRYRLQTQIHRLWQGSAAGIALACGLAGIFFMAGQWFSGAGNDWFFAGMMAVASLLIMQMIVWLHRHGRDIKPELERQAAKSLSDKGGFGIMLIAMIAVAREGSETVIFLAGIGSQYQGTEPSFFALGAAGGFALALLTFTVLHRLAHAVSWKWYFRTSETMLLLIGGAMMVSACDKIAECVAEWNLPEYLFAFMGEPLWNMHGFLSDTSWLASMLASLTGYRAQPSAMELAALLCYWSIALWLCNRSTVKTETYIKSDILEEISAPRQQPESVRSLT